MPPSSRFNTRWDETVGKVYTDLPYGEGAANKFDLYVPADKSQDAYGLVVYLHAGGFTSGDKAGDAEMLKWLCSKGYVAAGINYTLFTEENPDASVYSQSEEIKEWKTNFDHEHPDGTPGQDNLWLVSLLDFYKDHAEFYLALYHAGLSNIMLETLLGYFDRSPEIPNGLAYLNSAIGYMLYGWVHEWMNRGMQESGTEIARMFAEAQKKQA